MSDPPKRKNFINKTSLLHREYTVFVDIHAQTNEEAQSVAAEILRASASFIDREDPVLGRHELGPAVLHIRRKGLR